jgi:nucleotide-binding universal stress UspA family protein
MNRILVGADGSPDSQAAIRWSGELAAATDAELIVATAWKPGISEVSPDEYEDLRADAQTALDAWSGADVVAGIESRSRVLEGDPREALLEAADALDADLVVIGTRGTGRRHHAMHLGSVAHHLVHHARRPLAIAPVSARGSWPSTIVVGVDGSPHGVRALGWATDLARSTGSEVVAAYAEAPPAEFVAHDDPNSWYQRAQRDLDTWVADRTEPGLTIRTRVVDREPGPGIAEAGDREHAGLIVVGARGIGGVTGVRLGGTALKVLHHAHLPVVVVP